MRWLVVIMVCFLFSCDKVVEVDLPEYEHELVLEMYLEKGKPLRCLLTESLPYTDTAINKPVNDAIVIFSDGYKNDTLSFLINQDMSTGRFFNYYNPKMVVADPTKVYRITIKAGEKTIVGQTSFSQRMPIIDSLMVKESAIEADSFSVGLVFQDPVDIANYYRLLIGKNVSYFGSDPADVRLNDISFNGKPFSYFSEPDFAKNDTIIVRLYSLLKEHYDYLESMGNARRSNFNPFSQPGRIRSSIHGGLVIFTTIVYSERKIVIR